MIQPHTLSAPVMRPLQALASVAALALVLLSTVFRGSNRHVPLILIEWLGLALLLVLCFGLVWRQQRPPLGTGGLSAWAVGLLVASPLWVAALQTVLLTAPARTEIWASSLAGIPAAAMFLLALTGSDASLGLLRRTWIGVAVVQAVIGIAQLSGIEALHFGGEAEIASVGTFANRNHFANFLVMCIPLVILELKPGERQGFKSKRLWLWLCILFALVAALLASQSRAGLVTGVIAGTLSALVVFFSERRQSLMARIAVWLVPAFVLLAVVAGGMDWLSRFEWDALSSSALERAQNRDATWRGALANLPWGSGLGTFKEAFAPWQPAGFSYWLDYAHSDFLQLFFEAGVFAWVLAAMVVTLMARRLGIIGRALRQGETGLSRESRLSLVALCGVLALLIHTWVDFPTHIPANAMLGAFLLAVFLREASDSRPVVTKSKINGLQTG